ncbi:TIGR00282 family metallophosphoesterase [candidate division KSB1 bacterium]|nr:TIGR00282 family metallophosphoesterase [candidate division KSB1 bacterium]
MADQFTILYIADIIGKPGLDVIRMFLPSLLKSHSVDLCIANGENGHNGIGLNESVARHYFDAGIDIITGGNHIWRHASYREYLDTSDRVLRPLNYPDSAPGKGYLIHKTSRDIPVGVINLQGRTFMYTIDCPFRTVETVIDRLKFTTKIIIIDFHAEATAEKAALGWFLDGKVSAVIGSHTHVQTADERILPYGTAFITDAGMTGPHDSVIGMDIDTSIKRFITQIPEKYRMAFANNRLNGVVLQIDPDSGRTSSIKRISLPE